MTDERRNEIWAMLDSQCQNIAKDVYIRGNAKVAWAIEQFFGSRNLTAQAEEKPKEPRFKVGDKVFYYGQLAVVFNAHEHGYDVVFQGDHKLFNLPESHLEPYTELNEESNHIPDSAKLVDYAQYRLDLAKEIAVAMIAANWEAADIPHDAVEDANEIVKQLKETDNAD